MRRPSRTMPPLPPLPPLNEPRYVWATWPLTLFCMGVIAILSPPLALFVTVLFVAAKLALWQQAREDERRAAHRAGQSICQFARSFDCRRTDTWVIRAVYEILSRGFPVHATDRFEEDLRQDPEDLDGVLIDAAARAGISLKGTEANPLYGQIATVADIVHFLNWQPKIAAVRS